MNPFQNRDKPRWGATNKIFAAKNTRRQAKFLCEMFRSVSKKKNEGVKQKRKLQVSKKIELGANANLEDQHSYSRVLHWNLKCRSMEKRGKSTLKVRARLTRDFSRRCSLPWHWSNEKESERELVRAYSGEPTYSRSSTASCVQVSERMHVVCCLRAPKVHR